MTAAPPVAATMVAFVRLRWRLLRGAIRLGGADQVGAIVSTVASAVAGIGIGLALAVAGRVSGEVEHLAVLAPTLILLAVVGFGVIAGVAQPVDPRVVAHEPLSDRDRAAGLLASSAASPPGLAGIVVGVGLVVGIARRSADLPIVVVAALSWLLSLVFVARTATNLLALLIARFPRAGQLAVGVTGLLFYGVFQFVPVVIGRLERDERAALADVAAWTPPGLLGRAMAEPGAVGRAVLYVVAGSLWLPLLAFGFAWTTARLSHAVRAAGRASSRSADESALGGLVRRWCGDGPRGALAWRSILVRFRTPRTALETVTGAAVGLAAVLVPTLLRDSPGSGAVLVGGALQLAVLFMAGNSFGNDGPALTHELLTGIDIRTVVHAKARGIAIVAAPLVVVGPVLAAALTGAWGYLVAGFGVAIGGLLAGTGAAVVQSALVPIAVPESDNPFAGGESGKGMVAALLLAAVLVALAVATVPVALLLFWATDRGYVGLTTLFAGLTIVVGWALMRLGIRFATRWLHGRDPELVAAVTPAR